MFIGRCSRESRGTCRIKATLDAKSDAADIDVETRERNLVRQGISTAIVEATKLGRLNSPRPEMDIEKRPWARERNATRGPSTI